MRIKSMTLMVTAVFLAGVVTAASAQECFECEERSQMKNRVVRNPLCDGPNETGYVCLFRWNKNLARCVAGDELKNCEVKTREKLYPSTKFAGLRCERKDSQGRDGWGHCGAATGGAGPNIQSVEQYCVGDPKETEEQSFLAPEIDRPATLVAVELGSASTIPRLAVRVSSSLFEFALRKGHLPPDGPLQAAIDLRSPFPDTIRLVGLPRTATVVEGAATVSDEGFVDDAYQMTLVVDPSSLGAGQDYVIEIMGLPVQVGLGAEARDMNESTQHFGSSTFNCQSESSEAWLGPRAAIGSLVSDRPLTIVADVDDGCLIPVDKGACVADLVARVVESGLPQGTARALLDKLDAAAVKVADDYLDQAVAILLAFRHQLQAQGGKQVPRPTAGALSESATACILALQRSSAPR